MACQVNETENSIVFTYRERTGDVVSLPSPPPIITAASRNAVNGYVYVGAFGAPLGRDECLRLAEWLIRQAREMKESARREYGARIPDSAFSLLDGGDAGEPKAD